MHVSQSTDRSTIPAFLKQTVPMIICSQRLTFALAYLPRPARTDTSTRGSCPRLQHAGMVIQQQQLAIACQGTQPEMGIDVIKHLGQRVSSA